MHCILHALVHVNNSSFCVSSPFQDLCEDYGASVCHLKSLTAWLHNIDLTWNQVVQCPGYQWECGLQDCVTKLATAIDVFFNIFFFQLTIAIDFIIIRPKNWRMRIFTIFTRLICNCRQIYWWIKIFISFTRFTIASLVICLCCCCSHAISHFGFLAQCFHKIFPLEQMGWLSTIYNFTIFSFHGKQN